MIEVDAEDINDRAKLLIHRLIARRLRSDPGIAFRARRHLESLYSAGRGDREWWIVEWLRVLNSPTDELSRQLTGRDEHARRMRNCSPFDHEEIDGLDLTNVALRRRLWKKAKLGLTLHQRKLEEANAYVGGETYRR